MTGLSAGAVTQAIGDAAFVAIPVYGNTNADASAKDFPTVVDHLGVIQITVVGLTGAPATLDVKFTWDAAGDHLITAPSSGLTVTVGQTTSTIGTVVTNLVLTPLRAPSHMSTSHKVYVWIKFGAGSGDTATGAVARVHWKQG